MKKLLLIIALCLPLSAQANMDTGLYDPLPPEGSAFVRYINAAGEKGSKQTGANGKGYVYLENHEVSPYFVVEAEKTKVTFGELSHEFELEEGKFYSVLWQDDLSVIEDIPSDNRAKSQILFYNLASDNALSLKTTEGNVSIITDVNKNEVKAREINPVKINVSVFDGDTEFKQAETLSMERGMVYSAFAFDDSDDVVWVRSTTNTTK